MSKCADKRKAHTFRGTLSDFLFFVLLFVSAFIWCSSIYVAIAWHFTVAFCHFMQPQNLLHAQSHYETNPNTFNKIRFWKKKKTFYFAFFSWMWACMCVRVKKTWKQSKRQMSTAKRRVTSSGRTLTNDNILFYNSHSLELHLNLQYINFYASQHFYRTSQTTATMASFNHRPQKPMWKVFQWNLHYHFRVSKDTKI